MAKHDQSYKLLFSHPRMVEDLLRGFVGKEWVHRLDLSSLEKFNGHYVSDDLRGHEDDVIWRVRFADSDSDSDWLYVYLLLEFQSTVDPFMALRVMVYMGLLYQDLVAQKKLSRDGRLPPVLPVVLYNGSPRWNAALDVADLVLPIPELEQFRPSCGYLLLDEGRYSKEELEPLRNLVAALFRLESSKSAGEIERVLESLVRLLDDPGQEGLHRAFVVWLHRVLIPAKIGQAAFPDTASLTEVKSMLAERVVQWTKEWEEQGMAKGRAEGIAEGRVEGITKGRAELVLRQMEKRFGALSPEHRSRVQAAEQDELLRFGDRLLDATSIEEVFEV